MKIGTTIIIIALFAVSLIMTPIILDYPLISNVLAKTTHSYCYATRAGGIVENNSCLTTLKGCQQDLTAFREANPSYIVVKNCFKVTNSDKSTNNYCFDVEGGPSCFGSKKACQSNREAVLASFNGFRVSSQCYKVTNA